MTVNGPLGLCSVKRSPRPFCGANSASAAAAPREVGSQRVGGEQHAEGVLSHMNARRAEREVEFAPERERADARSAAFLDDADEARVALRVGAEAQRPRAARARGAAPAGRIAARRD